MIDIIKTRRSIRDFKKEIISRNDLKEILEAGMYAPSAGNEQAWQFIVLEGDNLKKYLELNQNVPATSPMGILVCMDKNLEIYKDANSSLIDCAAAVQNMLLMAHAKNYGAIWTYIFDAVKPAIKKLLNLPGHIEPFSFVPIGYAKNKISDIPNRYDESKIHYGSW